MKFAYPRSIFLVTNRTSLQTVIMFRREKEREKENHFFSLSQKRCLLLIIRFL
jgi:hypothetical protein